MSQKLIRLFPWIDLVVAIAGGVILVLIDKKELGIVAWVVGSMLTVNLLAVNAAFERQRTDANHRRSEIENEITHSERRLSERFAPVDRLSALLDLSETCDVEELRQLVLAYPRVNAPEFAQLRNQLVLSTTDALVQLASSRRSHDLARGEYYEWLLPMLESATPGSAIRALSSMMDTEWDESPSEERFVQASMDAAERGVETDRIFVIRRRDIARALELPPVRAHAVGQGPENLRGWLVEREQLQAEDSLLAADLGAGFILFDERVALIDRDSSDGGARGYVTLQRSDIQHVLTNHRRLTTHARRLTLNAG